MKGNPLLNLCVVSAAILTAARGRIGHLDQTALASQVAELAIDLCEAVERRAVSHRQSKFESRE